MPSILCVLPLPVQEVDVVESCVQVLVQGCGLTPGSLGVITPYAAQVALLSRRLQTRGYSINGAAGGSSWDSFDGESEKKGDDTCSVHWRLSRWMEQRAAVPASKGYWRWQVAKQTVSMAESQRCACLAALLAGGTTRALQASCMSCPIPVLSDNRV